MRGFGKVWLAQMRLGLVLCLQLVGMLAVAGGLWLLCHQVFKGRPAWVAPLVFGFVWMLATGTFLAYRDWRRQSQGSRVGDQQDATSPKPSKGVSVRSVVD